MHVNMQIRRLPSNSCQFPFSKRELYTSITCPVTAVWCPPCSSWGQMLRGQHECCILRELCDAKLLDFRMASSPGYQMFKNPKQMTMVSIQSSSTSHQGESCSAVHSPDLSVIHQACHVRADLLCVYVSSKNETHKTTACGPASFDRSESGSLKAVYGVKKFLCT